MKFMLTRSLLRDLIMLVWRKKEIPYLPAVSKLTEKNHL